MKSKRLLLIASMISKNDKVLDIGTDHAYLPIYLCKNNLATSICCSDISSEAILIAQKNIDKAQLSKKIKVFVSDGAENIPPEVYNTVTVSGMGTKTIKKIFEHIDIPKIIVQSNKDLYELRKYFNLKGYRITCEEVVFEKGFYYSVICYLKGKENLTEQELLFGKSGHKKYLKYLKNTYLNILNGLPNNKKEKFNYYLKMLDDLLKENRF